MLADRGHGDAANALRGLLTQHGIAARIEPTHASLEDVFVVATRKLDNPATRKLDNPATRKSDNPATRKNGSTEPSHD